MLKLLAGARINEEMVKEYALVEEFEKIRKGGEPAKAGDLFLALLPSAYYLLPTTFCLLPSAYCSRLTAHGRALQ